MAEAEARTDASTIEDASTKEDATTEAAQASRTEAAQPTPASRMLISLPAPLLTTAYVLSAMTIGIVQGFGMSLMSVNMKSIAGELAITTQEAGWLSVAYLVPNVSLMVILFKLRTQFGLRNFAEYSIFAFCLASLAQVWVNGFYPELVVRFLAGVAAAPMTSLTILYLMQVLPQQKKLRVGLTLAFLAIMIGSPVAGIITPPLLNIGGWQAVFTAELGMAMFCAAAVYMLPLESAPREKLFKLSDLGSYLILAIGLGCLVAVFTEGRLYWWFAADWIGWTAATGVLFLTIAIVIEMNRKDPLIDIDFLLSPKILHLAGILLLFRLLMSEQTVGVRGLFWQLGLTTEQMAPLYWAMALGIVCSALLNLVICSPDREVPIHILALLAIALGAWMIHDVTSQTRPWDLFAGQVLISFGGSLFIPPTFGACLLMVLPRGAKYFLTLIVIMLSTQRLGSIFGGAILGTFITLREKLHSHELTQSITLTNPDVVQRINQYANAYASQLPDTAARQAQALKTLASSVTQQAYVLAYSDAFLATCFLALFALACLLAHTFWKTVLRPWLTQENQQEDTQAEPQTAATGAPA